MRRTARGAGRATGLGGADRRSAEGQLEGDGCEREGRSGAWWRGGPGASGQGTGAAAEGKARAGAEMGVAGAAARAAGMAEVRWDETRSAGGVTHIARAYRRQIWALPAGSG
jgi:hypothetical protein